VTRGRSVTVGGETVPAGRRRQIEIPVARLPTGTWVSLPVQVVNGRLEGPRLWVSAAIHGDELNGVEIVRQVLQALDPRKLRGTVIAVPIVNVFGFLNQSRYLPDRRDLNRCFPGSPRGSTASRLAHLFMQEVVAQCEVGVDLHTASLDRRNLPQIRADLEDPETRRYADAFGAPIMLHSRLRDGSLREAAARQGVPTLVYEGGAARRFDRDAIATGFRGVLRLMACLDMWETADEADRDGSVVATGSRWVRAGRSGLLQLSVGLGDWVQRGQALGAISNTFGDQRLTVRAPKDGLVIGMQQNPQVNRGDAVLHLATVESNRPDATHRPSL
jgi:predicted deacylase